MESINKLIELITNLTTLEAIQQAIAIELQQKRVSLETYVPPSDALEGRLVAIWESVLNMSPLGIEDNFFQFGGDSLKAIQLIAKLTSELHRPCSVAELFQAPTIVQLASRLRQGGEQRDLPFTLPPCEGDFLPASFAEQRLWVAHHMLPEKAVYNITLAFRLKGDLKIERLKAALNALMGQHAILRTTFKMAEDGQIMRCIKERQELPLRTIKASFNDLSKLLSVEMGKEFDLETGPLVRCQLVHIGPADYAFIFTLHHIIADEASLHLLFRDLEALYQNDQTAVASASYADFATWQRHWLQESVLQTQLAYWKEQLSGVPQLHNLRAAIPRPKTLSTQAARHQALMPKTLLAALKLLGTKMGTTLFTTLLGVFQALLHHHSGDKEVLVGIPISIRHYPDVAEMVGFFVNTVAIKGCFDKELSFVALLKRLRQTLLEAFENVDAPFYRVVQALEIPLRPNLHPLVQICFSLKEAELKFKLPEIDVLRWEVSHPFTPFDLTLVAEETSDGLRLDFEYATDLFETATVESLSEHFIEIVAIVVANPDQLIDEICLPQADGSERQTNAWNNTAEAYACHTTVHALFEAQAKKSCRQIALHLNEHCYTYGQLDLRADHIANVLKEANLKSESLVVVYLPRSFDLIASLLAVLKAGCAFVPIDVHAPLGYLNFVLEDTKAGMLISHSSLKEKLPAALDRSFDVPILYVDAVEQTTAIHPPRPCFPQHLAYVIYTSGSNGQPKGVMVEHQALNNALKAAIKAFNIHSETCTLQFFSISFDASLLEWLATLLAGGRVVLIAEEMRLQPQLLQQLFIQHGITMAIFPPSFLATLPENIDLPTLHTLIVGGESSRAEVLARWSSKVRVINAYGPTETTIFSTFHVYDPLKPANVIGRPIDNTQAYILEPCGRLAEVGAIGEIYIGGIGVARGYLQRPAQENECFLPNSFSGRSKGRLYKTGDLARYLPGGLIEFVGRKDTQVKLNGHRIELQHIEAALGQVNLVRDVAVVLNVGQNLQPKLVAYVVSETASSSPHEQTQLLAALRMHLKQNLPTYMLPSRFIFLDKMPLLLCGKVDRKALPALIQEGEQEAPLIPPSKSATDIDSWLIALWEELLDVKGVHVDDNFFDLGGTSLLSIQLMSAILAKLKRICTIADFYADPTIAGLARNIDASPSQPVHAMLHIQENGLGEPLFLVHPSTGVASAYMGLKDHFSEKPIYGINNPFCGQRHFSCLKGMAAHYISVIRTLQPQGPYILGGWSFGGVVAFEMAQQLHASGEEVAKLILIDSYHSLQIPATTRESEELAQLLDPQAIHSSTTERKLLEAEMHHNAQLLRAYCPKIYTGPGPTHVLKARGTGSSDGFKESNAWSPWIKTRLETHTIAGEHARLFAPPYVREIAETLRSIFKC